MAPDQAGARVSFVGAGFLAHLTRRKVGQVLRAPTAGVAAAAAHPKQHARHARQGSVITGDGLPSAAVTADAAIGGMGALFARSTAGPRR